MNLNEQKKVAKDECMETKKKYLKTMSTEDWKVYCDKKKSLYAVRCITLIC